MRVVFVSRFKRHPSIIAANQIYQWDASSRSSNHGDLVQQVVSDPVPAQVLSLAVEALSYPSVTSFLSYAHPASASLFRLSSQTPRVAWLTVGVLGLHVCAR
jgi:hypothetical protein